MSGHQSPTVPARTLARWQRMASGALPATLEFVKLTQTGDELVVFPEFQSFIFAAREARGARRKRSAPITKPREAEATAPTAGESSPPPSRVESTGVSGDGGSPNGIERPAR